MKIFLIVIGVLFLCWIVYGYFGSRVAEPSYAVVEKKDGYEIREYAPYIEARVVVTGAYRDALRDGFKILAGYIFGDNTSKSSIAMTVPVVEFKSEPIAMTAPVAESEDAGGARTVTFVMPAKYSMATLPTPNDKRIKIVEIPKHRSAVLRYSGFNSASKSEGNKAKLLEYLKRDGVEIVGTPKSAGYNPPSTPPFMARNEIIIDIK